MNKPAAHWLTEQEAARLDLAAGTNRCIHYDYTTGWWYHTDETFSELHGPHSSRESATRAMRLYADSL